MAYPLTLDPRERHARGAHYTSIEDIQKAVGPTIVKPWRKRIDTARTRDKLRELHAELCRFRVLDPACGCGNFLQIAYLELRRLEERLLDRLRSHKRPGLWATSEGACGYVSIRQCFGIDNDPRAVALAKSALQRFEPNVDLDDNILCADALFSPWPKVDAILGNPPFQSKNKMQQELGVEYVRRLRARYPGVPGRADYCVYWFRRAHDELPAGGRAGLVGTNTIGQNCSREGGLDYIVASGGTIVEAVASQPWSGDAGVHVAIVNWLKGDQRGAKKLHLTHVDEPPGLSRRADGGDKPRRSSRSVSVPKISAALTLLPDVTSAIPLQVNRTSAGCYQGQTHGHAGFLLSEEEAVDLVRRSPACRDVVFPYLTGEELLNRTATTPWRFVIDFQARDLAAANAYSEVLARIAKTVLPARRAAARAERRRNGDLRGNRHHRRFLAQWWLLSYRRAELMAKLRELPRYIACSRVTTQPIFEFVRAGIHPSDVVQVFPFADDYSLGILQSGLHWAWFTAKCSTLGVGPRYTSETVFDTFPWPQQPSQAAIRAVAKAALALRRCRNNWMSENQASLRQAHCSAVLHSAQQKLNAAVREAYRMPKNAEPLTFLLQLNQAVAAREKAGEPVTAPGLPQAVKTPCTFFTSDCLTCGSVSVCRLSLRESATFRGAQGDDPANCDTT